MAKAIVTFKLMPESPETNWAPLKEKAQAIVKEAGAVGETRADEEPIAFGLKAVFVKAMFDVEDKDFEAIAAQMAELEGVQSAEVARMDLALG